MLKTFGLVLFLIRRVFILSALVILGSSVSWAADTVAFPAGALPLVSTLPSTIQISPELRTMFEEMWRISPTFQHQMQRVLAAPRLVITAQVDPNLVQRSYRARSSIRRYDSGLVVVGMLFGPGQNQAEWIAHELEHVIEQLDGVSVSRIAERRRPGAWYSGEQMVETSRATRAGRTVLAEVMERRTAQTSLSSRQAQ